MKVKDFFNSNTNPSITFLQIILLLDMLHISSTSDCDVEFIYSDYFNSNGFKVTCKDIRRGQENIIRYISAQNALILVIKNATLTNVTSDLFQNVPKLRELQIEDSQILVEGQTDLFSKLEYLQNMVLKNTKMEEIGSGTFSNLLHITTLHLENNSISSISKDSLRLNTLETLKITNNHLNDVEDVPLCNLPNIRVINFKKNRIKRLQPDLYECVPSKNVNSSGDNLFENNHFNIESIDLSHNEITTLNGAFKSFSDLNYLNLENNSLSRISDSDFEMLTDIEYLNIADNSIYFISKAAFTKLYNLKQINLSRNRITSIQLQFLPQLSEINLAHNKLTFENIQSINYLPASTHFDLSYNDLNGTSYFFNNFHSITILNLNGNNVILENDMFSNISGLQKLYLSNNGILHIPDLIFQNMTSLLELDLSRNKLDVLDNNDVFSSLTNLQLLNLSYNNLRSLNHNLFTYLDDVEILDIAGNKLIDLDYPLIINNMRSLETVNINNNLFSCDFLHKVVRYFAWKGVKYKEDEFDHYNEENIGGIQCKEESTSTDKISGVKQIEKSSFFIILLIAAILSVFMLMLIIIMKYYQFYRRSKIHCEQLELIED